jgi:hypothetical protein
MFAKFTPTINKIFFSAVYDFTFEKDVIIKVLLFWVLLTVVIV